MRLLRPLECAYHIYTSRRRQRFPIDIYLSPSYECNLNCVICGQRECKEYEIVRVADQIIKQAHIGQKDVSKVNTLMKEVLRIKNQRPQELDISDFFDFIDEHCDNDYQRILILRNMIMKFCVPIATTETRDVEFWSKLTRSIRTIPNVMVSISGGEPFLRWDLLRAIIGELKAENTSNFGEIITNGTLIDNKKARYLANIGWDLVKVSLDGSRPESNDRVRGKGTFSRIVNGIKSLINQRDAVGSELPRVGVGFVITRANYQDIVDMIEFAHDQGIDRVDFSVFYISRMDSEHLRLNEDEERMAWKLLEDARRLARKIGIHTNAGELIGQPLSYYYINVASLSHEIKQKIFNSRDPAHTFMSLVREILTTTVDLSVDSPNHKDWICYEPEISCYINPRGQIAPCCFFHSVDLLRLIDDDIIKTYNSDAWANIIERVNSNDPYMSCRSCGGWPRAKANKIERYMKVLKNPIAFKVYELFIRKLNLDKRWGTLY